MKFRLEQDNFYTKKECEDLITYSEEQSYKEALIRVRGQGEVYE